MKHLSSLLFVTLLIAACAPTAPDETRDMASSASATASSDAANALIRTVGEATVDLAPGAGSALTITLDRARSEDADGTQRTKAAFRMRGALEGTVALPDVLGELQYVDPRSYKPSLYVETQAETLAVLSSWWAGQGEEIWITQSKGEGPGLIIEHRFGDEGTAEEPGLCSGPGLLTDLHLPPNTTVALEGFGEPSLTSSSLSYCEGSQTR